MSGFTEVQYIQEKRGMGGIGLRLGMICLVPFVVTFTVEYHCLVLNSHLGIVVFDPHKNQHLPQPPSPVTC